MSGFRITTDVDGAVLEIKVVYEDRVPETVDLTEAMIQSLPALHMELERRRITDGEMEGAQATEV